MKDTKDLETITNAWARIFNKLSYIGYKKAEIYREFNEQFGEGDWEPAHFFDGEVVSREQGYLVYEEAYYEFLKNNPKIREKLVATASEVYDIAPSNVESGLDYSIQECDATHLQDISIRRALIRLRLEEQGALYDSQDLPNISVFEGDHLVQVRDHTTEGYKIGLNPGQIPFHKPELILDTNQKGWWNPESVEGWYQRNKVLLVNPEKLLLKLDTAAPELLFFTQDKKEYLQASQPNPELSLDLRRIDGRAVRRLYAENSDYVQVMGSPQDSYSRWRKTIKKPIPSNDKRTIDFKDIKW